MGQIRKGTIEFKNYFKQIPVRFKIYADFKCTLKSVESFEEKKKKNIKITFLAVLLTNGFVFMTNQVNQWLSLGVKMLLTNLLKQFLRSINTVKK